MASLRFIAVFAALWLLTAPARASGNDARQAVESTARQFIALAHEGRPIEEQVRGSETYQRSLRNAFRVRCLELEGTAVRELAISGDHATAELEIAVRKSRTPDVWMPLHVSSLRLRLTTHGGGWRVAAIEFPDDELAEALLVAPPPQRQRLMASERLTPNVARVIAERARTLLMRPNTGDARAAAELARNVAQATGDLHAESKALAVLTTLETLRDRNLALRLSHEALSIAEPTGDPDTLAWAWIAAGNARATFDQHSEAADAAFRTALSFAEQAESPHALIGALHIVGGRAFIRGDHFTTRLLLERSLPLIQESGDWPGALWYDVQLGYIYYMQGDHDRSLHHLRRGLQGAEQHDAWITPYVLLRLAEVHIAQRRFDDAAAVLERARRSITRKHGLHATLLAQLATIEAERGRLEEAECLARDAAASWMNQGYHYGAAVDVLFPHLARQQRHRTLLRFALEHAGHMQERVPIATVAALTYAAQAYRALGFTDRARAAIEEAIAVREELNEGVVGGEEQHVRSSDSTASCYELAAEIALDRGEVGEALAFIERGRGRVLHDALRHHERRVSAESEFERATRQRHEEAMARLNVRLTAAEANGDAPCAATLREELDAMRREHQTFLDGLRARHERRSASGRIESASVGELLHKLPPGVAAVEYVMRDEQVHAFVLRAGRVTRHTIAAGREQIERRVAELVGRLTKRDFRYRVTAKEIYALLLRPLERDLAGADALVIVPDDVLWRVPFAALVDGAGRFAVERWPMVYAPSISVYVAMAEKRVDVNATSVFALANPAIEHQTKTALGSFYRDVTLAPLPDAEREADALCALYGRCVVLKGHEATETRVRSAISGHRIVHFATHGVLDDRNPMYSRLVLGRGDGAADDGALEAWEIARLDIDADLVVLSACDTARGAIGGGEGVVGMAWAFFVAGARSTLATQWKVSSESAAELMIAFHRSLRAHDGDLRKAHALRDAQLRMLRDARTKHPFYWGSFVILGAAG